MNIKMLENDERQEYLLLNKNIASNSFTGNILHKSLGPPERQINMKLNTVLASLLGLLAAFRNTIPPWYCKIDFT